MSIYDTPLRYPGGKSRIAYHIASIISKNDFIQYCEPMVGGGSVFLAVVKLLGKYKQYWINDINQSLVAFWLALRDYNDELIAAIQDLVQKSLADPRETFYDLRKANCDNIIQEAARFYFLNKASFSGVTLSGGFSISSYRDKLLKSDLSRLRKYKYLLENVKITSLDFQDVISNLPDKSIIFLDPPYFSNKKSKLYGEEGALHVNFDHDRLKLVLDNTKNKWLMTYDDVSEIRMKYSTYNIVSFNVQYYMNGGVKCKNEILISNFLIDFEKDSKLIINNLV